MTSQPPAVVRPLGPRPAVVVALACVEGRRRRLRHPFGRVGATLPLVMSLLRAPLAEDVSGDDGPWSPGVRLVPFGVAVLVVVSLAALGAPIAADLVAPAWAIVAAGGLIAIRSGLA